MGTFSGSSKYYLQAHRVLRRRGQTICELRWITFCFTSCLDGPFYTHGKYEPVYPTHQAAFLKKTREAEVFLWCTHAVCIRVSVCCSFCLPELNYGGCVTHFRCYFMCYFSNDVLPEFINYPKRSSCFCRL